MIKRLIIGITGATGIIYGVRLLTLLKAANIETHLILSKAAMQTRQLEAPEYSLEDIKSLASVCYSNQDIGATIASGSFKTDGMIIAPCSMRTLSDVANGQSASLISRAADVCLKERRRLVMMVRETPFSLIHLRNMTLATEAGAIIAPPVPAWYTKPESLDDIINEAVGRVLDLFNLELGVVTRWKCTD